MKRYLFLAGLGLTLFLAGAVSGVGLVFFRGQAIAGPVIEAATWVANASAGPVFRLELESTLDVAPKPVVKVVKK